MKFIFADSLDHVDPAMISSEIVTRKGGPLLG